MFSTLSEILVTIRMTLLPRRQLEQDVADVLLTHFCRGASRVAFFKSGRSALSAVFRALAGRAGVSKVLVPDYICNVVPRAVTLAGLRAVVYKTNDSFEPVLADLDAKLRVPEIGAVVLASLFGADNTGHDLITHIRFRRPSIYIVLDDCQNLVLNRHVSVDKRTVIIFSFNGKTVRGAMGGGIAYCGRNSDMTVRSGKWRRDLILELAVCMVFAKQCAEALTRKFGRARRTQECKPPRLEYSHAVGRIHYDMDVQRIAKLSLVRGLIELRRAPYREARRKHDYARFCAFLAHTGVAELVPTASPDRAPFVPVRARDISRLTRLPLKGAYAMEGQPSCSGRPDVICFRNDGTGDCFFDSIRGASGESNTLAAHRWQESTGILQFPEGFAGGAEKQR